MEIKGHYVNGCGKAHCSSHAHEPIFGCPMIGTFNVRTKVNINNFMPTVSNNGRRYWLLKINGAYEAWAFRWDGSKMPGTTWELVSKVPLPDELKKGAISIEVL
jgi:hypothetical protein